MPAKSRLLRDFSISVTSSAWGKQGFDPREVRRSGFRVRGSGPRWCSQTLGSRCAYRKNSRESRYQLVGSFRLPRRLNAQNQLCGYELNEDDHGLNSLTASMTRVCSASVSAQKNGRRRRQSLMSSVTGWSPALPPYRRPNLETWSGR
jgi:hypothetical protein